MKKIISLNGQDKSGKTTQLQLIYQCNKLVHIGRRITTFEPWPKLNGLDLFNWWFRDGKTEDVISTIYSALSLRNQELYTADCPIVIVNRGDIMFDAVCAATTTVREQCSITEAEEFVKKIKARFKFKVNADENIFYKIGEDVSETMEHYKKRKGSSEFPQDADELYIRYQAILAAIFKEQLKKSVYSRVIDAKEPVNKVFDETQKTIIGALKKELDLTNIEIVIGLGGLSESGKSRIGNYLKDRWNFNRIKIKELISEIDNRYNRYVLTLPQGIYSIGHELTTILFAESLSKRTEITWQRRIIIESLHNYSFTNQLKRLMGNKFMIIYVDTPLEIRIQRNAEALGSTETSEKEIARKDFKKLNRGAYKVKDIADKILDNSGKFEETCSTIDSYLKDDENL